jgi:RNA methyltransferase, TrmH family
MHPEPASTATGWDKIGTDSRYVLLDGLHAIKHAARFGAEIDALITTDRSATLALAAAVAPDLGPWFDANLITVSPAELAATARSAMHPVVGWALRPAPGARSAQGPTVLLENPRNLGNLGAAIRLAAGFGAAVLSTGSVDPWHPQVVRAAAGLHFATSVARVEPESVPGPLHVFDRDGADLRSARLPADAVLVFGSERHGVSQELKRRAAAVLAIPIADRVSSYNLAASVGIGLYHWALAAAPERLNRTGWPGEHQP